MPTHPLPQEAIKKLKDSRGTTAMAMLASQRIEGFVQTVVPQGKATHVLIRLRTTIRTQHDEVPSTDRAPIMQLAPREVATD